MLSNGIHRILNKSPTSLAPKLYQLRCLSVVSVPTLRVQSRLSVSTRCTNQSFRPIHSSILSHQPKWVRRNRMRQQCAGLSSAAGEFEEVVPPLGDSVTEGTIVEWLKEVDDYVAVDEVICVLETDKVSIDIRSSQAGAILSFGAEEGDTVEVGDSLIVLDLSADAPETAAPETAAPETAAPETAAPAAPAAPVTPATPATPVEAAPSSPPPPPGSRQERSVPLSRMRLTIAGRLKDAQNTAAMLTTFNEVDMKELMDLRTKYKDEFLETHGVKLGFMSAFVKASTQALQNFPDVNAFFDLDGKCTTYRDYVDISVAVATPTGLVVPVLRNTESMSFMDVEREIGQLGMKARENKITLEDMTGGTFTISNGGVYGSLMGTPIINPPQSAILGMHGIQQRPVVIDGQIEIRPMMYLALTYDHRIVDGGGAVLFLRAIKNYVENPAKLLLNL